MLLNTGFFILVLIIHCFIVLPFTESKNTAKNVISRRHKRPHVLKPFKIKNAAKEKLKMKCKPESIVDLSLFDDFQTADVHRRRFENLTALPQSIPDFSLDRVSFSGMDDKKMIAKFVLSYKNIPIEASMATLSFKLPNKPAGMVIKPKLKLKGVVFCSAEPFQHLDSLIIQLQNDLDDLNQLYEQCHARLMVFLVSTSSENHHLDVISFVKITTRSGTPQSSITVETDKKNKKFTTKLMVSLRFSAHVAGMKNGQAKEDLLPTLCRFDLAQPTSIDIHIVKANAYSFDCALPGGSAKLGCYQYSGQQSSYSTRPSPPLWTSPVGGYTATFQGRAVANLAGGYDAGTAIQMASTSGCDFSAFATASGGGCAHCECCDLYHHLLGGLEFFDKWTFGNFPGSRLFNAYCQYGDCKDEAFWDGEAWYFGSGCSLFFPLATCDDVVVHEIAHAFTHLHGANLRWYGGAQAVEEFYSDLAGVAYKNGVRRKLNASASLVWDIGADCTRYLPFVRDMAHPDVQSLDPGIIRCSDYSASLSSYAAGGVLRKFVYRCVTAGAISLDDIFLFTTLANEYYWAQDTSIEQAMCGMLEIADFYSHDYELMLSIAQDMECVLHCDLYANYLNSGGGSVVPQVVHRIAWYILPVLGDWELLVFVHYVPSSVEKIKGEFWSDALLEDDCAEGPIDTMLFVQTGGQAVNPYDSSYGYVQYQWFDLCAPGCRPEIVQQLPGAEDHVSIAVLFTKTVEHVNYRMSFVYFDD